MEGGAMRWYLCGVSIAAVLIQLAGAATEYAPAMCYGKADGLPSVCALAIGKDDFLVVGSVGKVFLYDPAKEQSVRSFDSGFAQLSAVAVEGDTIFVFARRTEVKDFEYNGRKYKRQIPVGAQCKTFGWDGKPLADLDLGDLKDVTNAKVVGGKIYAADYGGTRAVRSFDAKTGAAGQAFGKDLRLCCGILDFAVDEKSGDVWIANLGAFRLERYSPTGSARSSFGQRGSDLESFQGCCNPVSAAVLPDGNLVVAEKDPSRVKVYTPRGKMLCNFGNLQDLVKGCNQVSVAVDRQGRVYLGVNAKEHFVLQYAPKS